MRKKTCSRCGAEKSVAEFYRASKATDGYRSECKDCRTKLSTDDAKRRMASDHEALRPEDFAVSNLNDGRVDPAAAKEKRQEFSRAMGEVASALRLSGGSPDQMPPELGTFLGTLAEQERRFGNRSTARQVSLAAAQEELSRQLFIRAAKQYLQGKVEPAGYALRSAPRHVARSVVLHFSDLHLGSDLLEIDNPIPFRAIEESRRLEFIVRETIDYKPRHRENSELVLLLNGDLIEGYLGHDLRDGAPLTEQKVVFWKYFQRIIGLFAETFPRVRVECQPGNHGRDKIRHPGRATSSKWDGHEWAMYFALSQMCSSLRNVSFHIPLRAVSVVDLHGSNLLLTHGDTEVKLGDPDTQAGRNSNILDRINANRVYGCEFQVATFGHFHKPRYQVRQPRMIFNGALVPPNGYARTQGYIGEPCGQFLWEAVEGYPVGDVRFLEVGRSQDRDERLGKLIPPFRFGQP